MSAYVLDVVFGILGGLIPGGVHMAWNITRGTKVTSGTIDFTLRPIKVTPPSDPGPASDATRGGETGR